MHIKAMYFSTFILKPIFHCGAKYLASGVAVGHCPRRQNFALEIPTCWYILALPNAKICVTPDANPRCQSVEYRWRWVFWHWPCIFHVYFMYILCIFLLVCASFSALATQKLADAKADSSGIWALGFSKTRFYGSFRFNRVTSLVLNFNYHV